jgi:hypothetical protein
VLISTLAIWYVCPGEETVFNSEHCLNTVRHIHIWSLLHTCGYFLSDFLVIWFLIKGDTTLDIQTLWHHALGAFVFYETLLFMDFCVVFGTMLLFTEISTFFLAIRYFLYTHDLSQSFWYYGNVVVTFFVFLIGRLYYQIYISLYLGVPFLYDEVEQGKIRPMKMFIVLQMAFIVIASLILNFYWFYLMCKMIFRVLGRMLCPKKDKEEAIELVRADQLKEAGESGGFGSSDEHGNERIQATAGHGTINELGGL